MNSRQSSPRSSFPSQRHRKQRELPRYDVRNVINRKRASKNGTVRSRSPKSVSRSKSRSRSRSRPRLSKKNSSRSPPRRSPPRRSPPRRSTPMRSRSRNRHCDQIDKQFVYFTIRIGFRRFNCKLKGLILIIGACPILILCMRFRTILPNFDFKNQLKNGSTSTHIIVHIFCWFLHVS